MHGFVDAVNRWAAEWTTLVVALVWQSTLVALLVACAAYLLSRSSPAVRYWLWQIVAIKLLVLPLWAWSIPLPWLTSEAARARMAMVAPAAEAETLDFALVGLRTKTVPAEPTFWRQFTSALGELTWRGWLFVAWAAIVVAQIGRLAMQRARLSQLLRQTRAGDDRLRAVVGRIAARLKLKRPPKVVTTEVDCSPFVCRIFRPLLVLPRELAETLDPGDLEQIVAHELAHVKRRDLVWGWIPQIARALYFFHPIAHLAAYRIRLQRELACDQLAMIDSGRSPGEYADTLVRVLSSASRPSIFRTSAAAPLDGGVTPDPESEPMP